MYSYAVISIHPKTFSVANRGYFTTFRDALKALRDEATDYITKYKRYQTVVYINNDEEMEQHPDVRYFLKLSDQFPNRIEVFERRKVVDKGWLWNGKHYDVELIKVFDVVSANLPQENGVQFPPVGDYEWASKIQKETQKNQEVNLSQCKMMDELRSALETRRLKFKEQ